MPSLYNQSVIQSTTEQTQLELPLFTVGISYREKDRGNGSKVSYAGFWKPVQLSMAGLARHIGKGFPWMAGQLDGRARNKANVKWADLAGVDVDTGFPIERAIALPLVSQHAGLLIESASSTAEHQKYRIVFRFAERIHGAPSLDLVNKFLEHRLNAEASEKLYDASTKDCSRFYWGATGKQPHLLRDDRTLPADFLQQAEEWQAAELAKRKRTAKAFKGFSTPSLEGYSTASEESVREALSRIPRREAGTGTYNESFSVLCALVHAFGPQAGLNLARSWSPDDDWQEDLDRKAEGIARGTGQRVGLGTLFWIAKQYGWQPPKRERAALPVKAPSTDSLVYALSDRPKTWQSILASQRYLLDSSGTGTGKSYSVGELRPQDLGVKQLFYVHADHRNVDTPTLQNWHDLEGRHNGLAKIDGPDDKPILRTVKGDDPCDVAPNCSRTSVFSKLKAKGFSDAEQSAVICGGCPFSGECSSAKGIGFGFKHARNLALKAERIRCHPASLPSPESFDYSQSVLVFDEAANIDFSSQRDVTPTDIAQTIGQLANASPELLGQLQPLLTELLAQISRTDIPRHGLLQAQLQARLPVPPEIDLQALREALTISPEDIEGREVSSLDLDRATARRFAQSESAIAEQIESLPKQWLCDALEALQGTQDYDLQAHSGRLVLKAANRHLREICKVAGGVIFLDATASAQQIEKIYGVSPIAIKAEDPQSADVSYFQIQDFGAMGQQRGDDQVKRKQSLLSGLATRHGSVMSIDLKRHAVNGELVRFVNSRGSNCAETANALVIFGSPVKNLSAMISDYRLLTGKICGELEDPDFQEWLAEIIGAELLQEIGRLRANRRAGEKLSIFFVSQADLSSLGLEIQQIESASITPEAAPKTERLGYRIAEAAKQLWQQGKARTHQAIADLVGVTREWVCKVIGQLRIDLERASAGCELMLYRPLKEKFTPTADGCSSRSVEADISQAIEAIASTDPPDPAVLLDFYALAEGQIDWESLITEFSERAKAWIAASLQLAEVA